VTYRVLITDEYGYTDVLADGFDTKEQAEKFAKDIKGYMWHPQDVKLSIEEEPYDWLNLFLIGVPIIGAAAIALLYGLGALKLNSLSQPKF